MRGGIVMAIQLQHIAGAEMRIDVGQFSRQHGPMFPFQAQSRIFTGF